MSFGSAKTSLVDYLIWSVSGILKINAMETFHTNPVRRFTARKEVNKSSDEIFCRMIFKFFA